MKELLVHLFQSSRGFQVAVVVLVAACAYVALGKPFSAPPPAVIEPPSVSLPGLPGEPKLTLPSIPQQDLDDAKKPINTGLSKAGETAGKGMDAGGKIADTTGKFADLVGRGLDNLLADPSKEPDPNAEPKSSDPPKP